MPAAVAKAGPNPWGRAGRPPEPLTDEQRAQVARWVGLGAKLALRRSRGQQPADRDDAIGEAFLFMCKYVRTFNPRKAALPSHLGNAARYGAMESYFDSLRAGFSGLKSCGTAAEIEAMRPAREGMEVALSVTAAEPTDWGRDEPDPAIGAAIDALPDRVGQVIRWRYLDGLALHEIGERLGVTKERVRQIVVAGLELLRKHLGTPEDSE